MDSHPISGRLACAAVGCFILSLAVEPLFDAGAWAAPKTGEVATKYKAGRSAGFRLEDYRDELIECSALAAIHTWMGDSIGDDEGHAVRQAIARDYWIEVSNAYLTLAESAASAPDLSREVGARMRTLAAEWRSLTESTGSADWTAWYNRVDRCDAWRPERPAHSFYSKGKPSPADGPGGAEVAMLAEPAGN